jgi:hypothetical protein
MEKNGSSFVGLALRVLAVYALLFSQTAWAGQNQKAKATPAAQAAGSQKPVAEETPSRGGRNEGIKVHGHWTIEVRNPDGTVARHVDFENSLSPGYGAPLLAGLLGHASTVGGWVVRLTGNVGNINTDAIFVSEPNSPRADGPALTSSCPANACAQSTNLSVTVNNGTLSFSGSGVVPSAFGTAIIEVDTVTFSCPNTISPQACVASDAAIYVPFFTSAATSVNVSPGQTVAVTVAISFS